MDEAVNKGFLHENFRLFHLKDQRAPAVEPHYHEFDKLVVLLAGAVDYTVEGFLYRMRPGDVLFVRHHDIHCPAISPDSVYERVILWIAPPFLEKRRDGPEEPSLETCFDLSSARRACLYRPDAEEFARLKRLLWDLEAASGGSETAFGAGLLEDALFTCLFVALNRMALRAPGEQPRQTDARISEALRYIHAHLAEPLSVDRLAASCYLSRYYFMRRFKEATGCTVHGYILQKRMTAAALRLDGGAGVEETARAVGFAEYTAFLRAFRKSFGMTPSEYRRRDRGLEGSYFE